MWAKRRSAVKQAAALKAAIDAMDTAFAEDRNANSFRFPGASGVAAR